MYFDSWMHQPESGLTDTEIEQALYLSGVLAGRNTGDADVGKRNRIGFQSNSTKAELRYIVPCDEKGEMIEAPEAVQVWGDYNWGPLARVYEEKITEDGTRYLFVPKADVIYTNRASSPSVGMCSYEASDRLLRLHGLSLDSDDRDWFRWHFLTEEHGLPMEWTLRVLTELIAPYGMRIIKVRATPGTRLAGDLGKWREILGMNPLGMASRSTTNAEFAAATGYDPVQAELDFAFEYHPEPLRPGIIFEAPEGSHIGHASYAGPRNKVPAQNIHLSLQYGRVTDFPWRYAVPQYEYKVKGPIFEVDLWKMAEKHRPATGPYLHNQTTALAQAKALPEGPLTLGKGKCVKCQVEINPWKTSYINGMVTDHFECKCGNKWERGSSTYAAQSQAALPPKSAAEMGKREHEAKQEAAALSKCLLCSEADGIIGAPGNRICADCWWWGWSSLTCPNQQCNTSFAEKAPRFLGVSGRHPRITGVCSKCNEHVQLNIEENDDPSILYMLFALRGILSPQEANVYRKNHSYFSQRKTVLNARVATPTHGAKS